MLSLDSASPVILDMVTTTTENGSETSPSQNGKTSSYENLKKKVFVESNSLRSDFYY